MVCTVNTLPDDVESLKKLLLAERQTNTRLQKQIDELFESIRLARHQRFGASSEKAPGQGELFDEAEASVEEAEQTKPEESTPETSKNPKRRKTARKPLPAQLPRIRKLIELPESERVCPCGCELTEIGEDVSEQLEIIPAKLSVIQHVRKKYACKGCEDTIKSAPSASVLLPKAIASANTMAYIITAKYADGIPLYRLNTILRRYGIDYSRQTMSESVIATGQKIEPLMEHFRHQLCASAVMHMDETTVQVLNEPNKTPQSKSYMWVQRGGPPGKPIVLFNYDPSRSSTVPEKLLENYNGVLMSDGYAAYRKIAIKKLIIHLCCWAHVRRKFIEVQKAQPGTKTGRADFAIAKIAKLYAVEKRHKQSDSAVRQLARETESKPLLDEFKLWLEKTQQQVPPKSALGKAVNYALKYWPELSRYTDNGEWPIDNNVAENAIRPFVIGRKNWLFSNSPRGATASANLYSLIETAKANAREPYEYLSWLFERLPITEPADFATLMPWEMPLVPNL